MHSLRHDQKNYYATCLREDLFTLRNNSSDRVGPLAVIVLLSVVSKGLPSHRHLRRDHVINDELVVQKIRGGETQGGLSLEAQK